MDGVPTASSVSATNHPPKPRWLGGVGCALTFAIGTPAILVLLCSGVALWYQWRAAGYRLELARQEQRVRDAQEPLNGVELNAWYSIPSGDDDLTPLYLEILRSLPATSKELNRSGVPHF